MNPPFPVTPGKDFSPFAGGNSSAPGGAEDGFLALFDPDGELLWSTCVGRSENDYVTGIAADLDGNIYVTGGTSSEDFPVRAGFDMSHNGGSGFRTRDAFVLKCRKDGQLLWSTYLGGKDFNDGRCISVGDSIVAISGASVSRDFPYPEWDETFPGESDDYMIALLDLDGAFLGATVLGGSMSETSRGIAISPDGTLYLTGNNKSPDYPPAGSILSKYNTDTTDAFLTKIKVYAVGGNHGGNGEGE